MAKIDVDLTGIVKLSEAIDRYGAGAGQAIQQVYEEFAATEIERNINAVLPVSGRRFRGHKVGAKAAGIDRVFRHEVAGLDLTVKAPGNFGYLVFPDEGRGSHNRREQRFMLRGMEASIDKIVDRCIAKITEI